MEESDAERMKLKYASAYTDNNDIDNNLKYSIDPERQVESRKFIEIVEGRLEEIIENVWYQIPSEYYDKLLGGIILTGGGSNMSNIEQAFMNHTHVDKIRTAKFVTHTINATQEDIKAKDGKMNTVLGLLAKGDMNCAGSEVSDDLFGSSKKEATPHPADQRQARQASEIPAGVIRTEIEKQKAEEERRRQQEEIDRQKQAEEEAERKRIAAEKRENSPWNKLKKGILKFGKSIVEEEE
jgi:cell division protein FtsA